MNLKSFLFFFFILILCKSGIFGQSPMSVSNTICKASDYKFKIGAQFYDADKKGYICQNNLPAVVSIYSKKTNLPITATDIKWIGQIDGSYGLIYEAMLRESHFGVLDKIVFEVSFTENGIKENIKFEISKDLKVLALKSLNPSSIFDDVKDGSTYIKEYWPSHTPSKEKPWIFGGKSATLSVKNKRDKNAGKDAYKAVSVGTSGSGASISPPNFTGDNSNFNIGQSLNTSGSYPFINSCSNDTVAYIYNQGGKNYGIDFIPLEFSQDDFLLLSGNVPSDTSLCVAVGNDGYYTEAFRRQTSNNRGGPSYVSPNDSIIFSSGTGPRHVIKIVAGKDKKCDTSVPTTSSYTNMIPNLNQWLSECNSIYNQIGVNCISIINTTKVIPEYNIADNKLDAVELDILHKIGNLSSNINVFVVDSIAHNVPGQQARGRALNFGIPTIVMAAFANGFTLAHEIGHGKFSLRHPDNDPNHLMEDAPGSGPYNYYDINNFMFSTSNFTIYRVRHYQWKKILTGKYNN